MAIRRLDLFPNELDKEQDVQNNQVNLVIQKIASWGNRIQSDVLLEIADESAQAITSTSFVDVAGFQGAFKNSNPTVRIDVSLALNCNGQDTTIILMVDGNIKKTVIASTNGKNTISFDKTFSLNAGNHNLTIQIKSAAGTVNKIADSGSELTVTNTI